MKENLGVRFLALAIVLGTLVLTIGLLWASPGASLALSVDDGQSAALSAPVHGSMSSVLLPRSTAPYTTLVDLAPADPLTLDPHWLYDSAGQRVASQVYETLLMQKREDPADYVPVLATGWTLSADTQTYTFTIRSGVTFHEGGTLEAHDVAFSFWRAMLQDRDSGPAWLLLEPLLNVNNVEAVPGDDEAICQAVKDAVTYDDSAGTVTFHLAHSFSPILSILAYTVGSVVDQEWMTSHGDWTGDCSNWRAYHNPAAEDTILYDTMNGTGPFRFDHWTVGEVELVRYQDYWRTSPAWEGGPAGPAALESVLILYESDWATRRDMLLNGEADLINASGLAFNELDPFVWSVYDGPQDPVPSLVNPVTGTLYLFKDLPSSNQTSLIHSYNLSTESNPYIGSGTLDGDGIPPDFFADIHVRKGFNYAMDWASVIADAYNGEAIRSKGPIPAGMLGYNDTQPVYPFDLTLSEQELDQAWGGQVATHGFSMTVAYNEGSLSRQFMLETLAENLATIDPGYQVNVIGLPPMEFYGAVFSQHLPLFPAGWSEDYHHPHAWVQPFLYSQGFFGPYQAFPAAMAALFDAKVDQCIGLADLAAAETCYEELQNLAYEQATGIWGVQAIGRSYVRTEVRGYYFNPARETYYYALSKGDPPSVLYVPLIIRAYVP